MMTQNPLMNLPAALQGLCQSVHTAHHDAIHKLLLDLSTCLTHAEGLLVGLPAEIAQGQADRYTRHVVYADPHGSFTIAYLIWRPEQFSAVHGHKTWCAYRVLKGELTETHYRWEPATSIATAYRSVKRRAGDIVTASPGLAQIHRLGNTSNNLAISLHIYGVDQAHINAGVNEVIKDTMARDCFQSH